MALGGVVVVVSSIFAGPFIPAVSASTSGHLLQAQEVDATGPKGLIVGNFQGVYRTVDSGRHWANITPPVIASQPILLSHLNKIVSIGGKRIWLELIGDAQIDFTPYSSNGGLSWRLLKNTAVVLPSTQKWSTTGLNPQASVPKGFRLRDRYLAPPPLGWAQATGPEIGNFTPTYLLRTTNGGGTWTAVST
jgi:photosystem II stability/assembly factor-like uncharacterized protein